MKLVIRALVLWLLLAALTWLFASTGQDVFTLPLAFGGTHLHGGFNSWITIGLASSLIPAFCVWLTITAVPLLPRRWPGRLVFWMGTVAGWFAVAVMMQGRAESDIAGRAALFFGAGVTVLTAAWLLFKVRPFPAWRVLGEIAIAAVLWVSIGAGVLSTYNAKTRVLRQRAEARWAEIGLPMAEFEKTLVAGRENSGSAVLREVLRNQLGMHFYKVGTRLGASEPAIEQSEETKKLLKQATSIPMLPPSDDVNLSAQSVALLKSLAASLDSDYQRILSTEAPTWASDPHDGYSISVPNFLGIRQIAQLIAADTTGRFAAGDQEGAARALSAGEHLNAKLRENPTLVSLMIHVAVETLLAQKAVRLPASEDGLQVIASDAVALRAELLKRVQIESWACLRFADKVDEEEVPKGPLPQWLARIKEGAWLRRQMMMGALNGAEHAVIHKDPATLLLPDMGVSRHNALYEAFPSIMEANVSRAWMRIAACLLVREQAELIRMSRASLATGAPMQPYQSAAVPNARWEVTIDRAKAMVATRLVGPPEWIVKNEVASPDFWCLPLDGSVSWQFHRSDQATAGH
ncbi:MAG TPA: hypothetical protein VK961_24215 [Chthoniobacter sp.]|nr:hypothetical protein [Chthoniobacter sp.]